MSTPHILYSVAQIAQRLGREPRTIAKRLEKVNEVPFAIDVAGRAYYLEQAITRIDSESLESEAQQ